MKLAGEQLVLDTNVLLHWLRGREAGEKLPSRTCIRYPSG
jgi:hypothetical protein